jgi:3-oxoacyl-(acyl-carrier-protein) synthase
VTLPALEQLAVTGCGHVVGADCDSTPVLKSRKMRKFMGRQDELAVIAAVRAVEAAGLPRVLGERCGLYLSVGFIPFEDADLAMLVEASTAEHRFSMERFSTDAFRALSPLLTFRCLPNMPAFHVSLNLDVQGPYSVGYPGIGQFYLALEEAASALDDGTIDIALVGGVADQDNVLVQHHFSRIDGPIDASTLTSAAGFLVLERQRDAERRGAAWRARPIACEIRYCPADPFEVCGTHEERTVIHGVTFDNFAPLGPASLAVALSTASGGMLTHTVRSRDRFVASSEWEIA